MESKELKERIAGIVVNGAMQPMKATNDIMQLINSALVQQLIRLEGEIPDEKIGTEKLPLDHSELGYNVALQDVKYIIQTEIQRLEGDSND